MSGAYSTHGKEEKYNIVAEKCEGKSPFETPRRRLEDNIRMDVWEIGTLWTGRIWLRTEISAGLL
jgi:hypothetical protein